MKDWRGVLTLLNAGTIVGQVINWNTVKNHLIGATLVICSVILFATVVIISTIINYSKNSD